MPPVITRRAARHRFREHRVFVRCAVTLLAALGLVSGAAAQVEEDTFDACGTLAQRGGCILFEGGGGTWVITDAGGFSAGDFVRVVGTADENCITICGDVDGCIRGATVYDPAVFPCGTPLPNFPGDIIGNVCSALGPSLIGLAAAGLWLTRPRGRGRRR